MQSSYRTLVAAVLLTGWMAATGPASAQVDDPAAALHCSVVWHVLADKYAKGDAVLQQKRVALETTPSAEEKARLESFEKVLLMIHAAAFDLSMFYTIQDVPQAEFDALYPTPVADLVQMANDCVRG